MLTKISTKIDKLYAVLAVVVILHAIYAGFVFRGVLQSISLANEIDNEVLQAPSPHLNQESLDRVYEKTIDSEATPLDLER